MKKWSVKTCWHRALAVLLAVSMVLIPVHFPGHAHAEGSAATHTSLFADNFDATYSWSCFELGAAAGKYNYSIVDSDSSAADVNGTLNIETTYDYKRYCLWLLNCVSDGQDIDEDWSNYTVSVDVKADKTELNDTDEKRNKSTQGPGIIGRVTPVDADDPSKGYTYYEVYAYGTGVRINKSYIDSTEAVTRTEIAQLKDIGGAPHNEKRRLEVAFENTDNDTAVAITVKIYDENGTLQGTLAENDPLRTYVDKTTTEYGAPLTTGGTGLTYAASTTRKKCSTQYDNFEVALTDGSLIFKEDFGTEAIVPEYAEDADETAIAEATTAADTATKAFMGKTKSIKNGLASSISGNWSVTGGTYASGSEDPSVSYVAAEGAEEWTDYIVKADMVLDATDGVGSLIARYSDAGYYEMRVNADGTVGLYRSGVAAALKTAEFNATVADAQLEVYGTKLIGSIGGEVVVEYDTKDDENRLTAGTAGVASGTKVAYDNFSVTEHVWASTWSSDDGNHWHKCEACDAKKDEAGHTGGDAKCNAKAICFYCSQPYGDYDEDDHAAEAEWVKTPATHEMKYYDCCDATVTAEADHSWVNGKCFVCEYECQHPLGTDANCIARAECDECGMQYGEPAPNNHKGQLVWRANDSTHKKWYEDCCELVVVEEEGHDWEDGVCKECTWTCNHTGGTANCQSGKICEICEKEYTAKDTAVHTKDAKWTRTETKHTKIYECCSAIAVEEAEHTLVNGICSVCNYGCTHKGGEATCTAKAKCEVCGEEYSEKDADNHTKDAKWANTADKHKKTYECCGKVVIEEASHTGGTATCEDKAVCAVCGGAYGELAAHKGGEATCTAKAECDVCGEEYGEKNASNHAGEAKWTKTADKHSKAYECCGAVVVAEAAHKLTDGKCECGYEAPKPVEPGEIENTTDADKNACGGTLDVKDEHLADKLLTEEEKKEVETGADINIYLTVEDISDKVSAADKAEVEKNLNGMKVGLYLDINLEKQVGNKTPVKITETNGGVTVTITVPAELRNTDTKYVRTYKVIRVHEGKTDILDATYDAKTNKLSFETDKFSTYTLVYSDAPSSDNSNTGDSTAIVLFGGLLAIGALAVAVLLVPDIRKKLMGK